MAGLPSVCLSVNKEGPEYPTALSLCNAQKLDKISALLGPYANPSLIMQDKLWALKNIPEKMTS